MAKRLSHLGDDGAARMVDVSGKAVTVREAVASGFVRMGAATLALIRDGKVPKGDVIATARLAGIMAAKRTSELVPLCHPIPIEEIAVDFDLKKDGIGIEARVKTTAKTGVEMEALTAVSVAALAIYDMCKAVERGIEIGQIRLERKSGGKSDDYKRGE